MSEPWPSETFVFLDDEALQQLWTDSGREIIRRLEAYTRFVGAAPGFTKVESEILETQ